MQIEKPLANLSKEKQNYEMKYEKEEISTWKNNLTNHKRLFWCLCKLKLR